MTKWPAPSGRLGLSLLTAALALASCASADEPEEAADPIELDGPATATTIDGLYLLSALSVDGADEFRGTPAVIEAEGELAALKIDTGCGTQFGSFSLFDDGTAGFTIAGGSTVECDATQAEQERQLLNLLAEVDQWSIEGDLVRLSTPTGDSLSMTR